jgi:hypothetical protein
MTMMVISFYVIGCILGLLVYDIIIYEKYNNKLYKEFNRKDILSISFIMFSWLYLISLLLIYKKINFNVMKSIKKLGKKLWQAYREGVEMQYRCYYR